MKQKMTLTEKSTWVYMGLYVFQFGCQWNETMIGFDKIIYIDMWVFQNGCQWIETDISLYKADAT